MSLTPSHSIAPFPEAEHKVFCPTQTSILVKVEGRAQARVAAQSADVRFGSEADISCVKREVRFTPKSRHRLSAVGCLLSARSRHLITQEMKSVARNGDWNALAQSAIYDLADLSLESECGGVSTFRKAQKYSLATPSQSSTLSPSNSATALMPLPKAGQTFQQATQAHPLGLYANQG